MKAFAHLGPHEVGWIDAPMPRLKQPYGAILQPLAVAPCSSDVHTIDGGKGPKIPNLILGHECVARVVEVAEEVRDFAPGDIVLIPAITPNWRATAIQEGNYGHAEAHFSGHLLGRTEPGVFAEYVSIADADTTLEHLPEDMSLQQGLMCVDVMTTGFTGAESANIKTGDVVCVIGIGPIGLMAVAGARCLGASRIIAVGSRPLCVDLARRYGATDIVDYHDGDIAEQVLRMTDEIGPDSVIIAGGGDEVFTQAVDMVRYGIGTIANVNYYGGEGSLHYPKFSGGRGMAGKSIRMELARGGRARLQRMIRMVQYGRVDPEPLVTHVLDGWDSLPQAIDMMRDKRSGAVKVMVRTDAALSLEKGV